MTIYLASEIEQHALDAEAQISANCHFPNGRGTDKWANVFHDDTLNLFYFLKPLPNGWSDGIESFTQSQMMSGVVIGSDGVKEYEW